MVICVLFGCLCVRFVCLCFDVLLYVAFWCGLFPLSFVLRCGILCYFAYGWVALYVVLCCDVFRVTVFFVDSVASQFVRLCCVVSRCCVLRCVVLCWLFRVGLCVFVVVVDVCVRYSRCFFLCFLLF